MFSNKKGVEEPRVIVYTLYVSILLIIGIFMIKSLTGDVCTSSDVKILDLDFNAVASRVMYSPECFAKQSSYVEDDETKFFVEPGTLEREKITEYNLLTCVEYPRGDFGVSIKGVGSTAPFFTSEDTACSGSWDRKRSFLVLLQDESGGETNGIATFCLKVDETKKDKWVFVPMLMDPVVWVTPGYNPATIGVLAVGEIFVQGVGGWAFGLVSDC